MSGQQYRAYPGYPPQAPYQASPHPQQAPPQPQYQQSSYTQRAFPSQQQPYPPSSPFPPRDQQPGQSPFSQSSGPGYNRPPPPVPSGQLQSYGQQPQHQQYPYQQQQQPQYLQQYPQQTSQAPSPFPQHQPLHQSGGYSYGQAAPQYPPQGQQQYPAQPQQQQFGQQPPYGQPQQPSYGGASAAAGPQELAAYQSALDRAVVEKQLQSMIQPGMTNAIAADASAKVNEICQMWKIPLEVGRDLARLGLYDVVLYIDDSGSMAFEENGERIDDLKLILQRVAFAATRFDKDGISVRFMNTQLPEGMGDHITTEDQINRMMSSVKFSGLTPMGRELKRKVVDGIVLRNARQGGLRKPVLVITITDGQPAGDEPNNTAVFDTVHYAVTEVSRATGTSGAISFQFAQVGNDTKAREFLGKLDTDPRIGAMVDCTSNFEQEQQEMMQQSPPVELTPDLWMVKLLLGSIDPSYDSKDEQRSWRPGANGTGGPPAGPPPGQYGAPPPGQYGAPAPGQYGAPGGYPPVGQGQGQQYSRPAPPQPPGNYGGYPQQQQQQQQGGGYGGYPPAPAQGGYGAPPPPPRY